MKLVEVRRGRPGRRRGHRGPALDGGLRAAPRGVRLRIDRRRRAHRLGHPVRQRLPVRPLGAGGIGGRLPGPRSARSAVVLGRLIPTGSGWLPGFWCCPTIIRSCSPNERRPWMRCRAGGFGCASASAGCAKRSRHAAPNSKAAGAAPTSSWQCCGRCGTAAPTASTHHGEFFQFENVVCSPKPIAGQHLPVHIGGHSKAAARRAGRFGDGFQPLGVAGAQLDGLLTLMRDEAAAAGRDPADIEVSLGHSVTKIDRRTRRAAGCPGRRPAGAGHAADHRSRAGQGRVVGLRPTTVAADMTLQRSRPGRAQRPGAPLRRRCR